MMENEKKARIDNWISRKKNIVGFSSEMECLCWRQQGSARPSWIKKLLIGGSTLEADVVRAIYQVNLPDFRRKRLVRTRQANYQSGLSIVFTLFLDL